MCNMDENKAVGESSDILRDEVECDDEAVQGVISAQREKIMTMRRLKRGMSTEIKGLNKVTITMKRQASFAEELQYLDGRQNENKLPKQTITKPPNSSSEIRSTLLIKNVSLKQKPLKETKQFRCEDEQKSLMGVATPDIHHIVGKYKPGPKSKRKLLNGCDNGPKIKSCRKSYDKSSEYITLQQLMDHCLHRYYRLKGANWECSSDAALKLLTKKYNSLKLLFSRTLVLQLKRVKLKIHPAMPPVKLQNESKGLTHCSSYESDDNKICHSRTQIKSVNPLVDPRVMSMSKALQSSNSGKVGIEKTFKSAPTLKKVKKDIKTKETGRKSLMSRPDWSKFKEKLKEANSRLISKKKDGLIIGKTLGNASLYANNTCSGLTSAPFVQAKLPHFRIPRKVLETDPSDSKLTIDSTTDKQKEQDTSKHDNIFDRFKCDNLAESKSNGGKKTIENFVLDGYTIEITRDSPVDVTMQEVSDDDDVAPETDIEHNASLLSEEIHKNIKHETLTVEESDENGIVDIENVSDEAHSTESVEQTCVETSKSNSGNCMSVSSLNIEGRNVVEIEDEQSSYEISETDKDKRNPTKDDINTTLQKMLHHIEHFGTDVNAVDDIVSSVLDGALQHVEDYSQFQIVENPDLQSKVSLQHPSKLGKVTNHSENRSQRCKCSYLHFDNLEQQGNDNKVVKCLCEVSTRENKQKEFTRCNDNTDFVINNKNDLHLKCQQCVEDDIILVEEVFTKKDCTCRNISAFKSANSNTLTPNLSSLSGHMNKKQQHCFLCKDAAYKISEYTNSPHDISREKSNKCTCEKHIPSLKGIKPKFVNTFVEMTETDSSAAKLEMDAKQVIVEDSETDDEIESDCNSANEVSTKLINLNEKTTAKTKTFSMPTKEVNKSAKTLEPTSAPTCTQCKDKDGKGQPYSDVCDEEGGKQGAIDFKAQMHLQEGEPGTMDANIQRLVKEGKPGAMDSSARLLIREEGKPGAMYSNSQRLMQEESKQGAMDSNPQRLMQEDSKQIAIESNAQRLMQEDSKPEAIDSNEQRLMQEFPKHNWLFTKYQNAMISHAPSPRCSSSKDGGEGLAKAKNTIQSKKKQEMQLQKCSKDQNGENIKTLPNRSLKCSSISKVNSASDVCGDDSVIIKVNTSKTTSVSNSRTAISKNDIDEHLDNLGTSKLKHGNNCVSQLQEEHEIPQGYTKQFVRKNQVQSNNFNCNKSFIDTYNEFVKRTTSNNMNDDEMKELKYAKEDLGKVPISEHLAGLDAGIQERCKDPVLAEVSPITAPLDEWNETEDDFPNELADTPEDLEETGNILDESLDSFSEIKQEPFDTGFKDANAVLMVEANKMSWNISTLSKLSDDDTDDEDLLGKRLQIDETADSIEPSLFPPTETSMSEVATSSEATAAPALSSSATLTVQSPRSPSNSAVFPSTAWINQGLCSPTAQDDSGVYTCRAIVSTSMAESGVIEDSNKTSELSLQKSESSCISFRQKPRPPVQLVYPMHKPDSSMAPNMPASSVTLAMVSSTMDTVMATSEENSQNVLSSTSQPVTMVNVPYTSPSLPAIPLYMGMVVPLQQFVHGSQAFIPQSAARPSNNQAEFAQGMPHSIRTAHGSELPTTTTHGMIPYTKKRVLDGLKTAVDKEPKYCSSVSKSVTTYRNIQPKVMTSTQGKGPPPLLRISDSTFTSPGKQEASISMVSMNCNVQSEGNMAQTKVGVSASNEALFTDPISNEKAIETVYGADFDETYVNDDDIDEDFKKQMEEIDQEITRKEKEQAEMRRKRLELIERAKQEKMKIKSTNITQKTSCLKAAGSHSTLTTIPENADCKHDGSFIMSHTLSSNQTFKNSDHCSNQVDVHQQLHTINIDTVKCDEEIKPENQFEEPNNKTVKDNTFAKAETYEHQEKNSLVMKMIDTKPMEIETYIKNDHLSSTEIEINNSDMKMDKMDTDHDNNMEKDRVDTKRSVTELKGKQSDINKNVDNSDETKSGPPLLLEEEPVDLSSSSSDLNKSANDTLSFNASCIESTSAYMLDEKYEQVDEQVTYIEDIRKINPFTGESELSETNSDTLQILDDTGVETEKQSSDSKVNHSKRKQEYSFKASTLINENMCLDLSKGRSVVKEKATGAEHSTNNINQPQITTSVEVVESLSMVDGTSILIQQTESDSLFTENKAITAMKQTSSSSKTVNDMNSIYDFPGVEDSDFVDLTIDNKRTQDKDNGSTEHTDPKKKAVGSRRISRRNRTLKELQEEAIQQLEKRKKNNVYDFDNLTVEDLSYTKNPNYFPKTSHIDKPLNMYTLSRKRSHVSENDLSGKNNATEEKEPKEAHIRMLQSPPRKKPKSAPVFAHTQTVETSKLLDVLSKCENPPFPIHSAQLCSLTRRKTPCFQNPRETFKIKPREKRPLKPAHSQKPFGIAGQLISRVSQKHSFSRSPLKSGVSISSSSSSSEKVGCRLTVDEESDKSPFPSHNLSDFKSDRSPIKAHQPPYGSSNKHHITRILRPPTCTELCAYGVNRDFSVNQSVDELSSALGKGQRSERSEDDSSSYFIDKQLVSYGSKSQVRNVAPYDAPNSGPFSRPCQSQQVAYQQYSHGPSPEETLRCSLPVEGPSQSPASQHIRSLPSEGPSLIPASQHIRSLPVEGPSQSQASQHIRYDFAGKEAPVSPADCDLFPRRDVHADRRMQDASPQDTYQGPIHNLLVGEQLSNRFSNQPASTHMLPSSQNANQQMQKGPYPNTQQQNPTFPPPPYPKSQHTSQYSMPGLSQSTANQAFDVNAYASRMMKPCMASTRTIPTLPNSSMPMMQMSKKACSQLMQSPPNPNTPMMQIPYNQNTAILQISQNTQNGMMQMHKPSNPQMMQLSQNPKTPVMMPNEMSNPMMQMPQSMGSPYTHKNPAVHRMQSISNSNAGMMHLPSNANMQGGQATQQMRPVYKPRIQGQPFRPGIPSNQQRTSMFPGRTVDQMLTDDERVFTMQQIRAKHIRTQQASMNQLAGIGDRLGSLGHTLTATKSSEAEQQTYQKTSQEVGGYQSYPKSPRPAGMGSKPYVVSSQMNNIPSPSNMSACHSQPSNSSSRLPSEQQTTYSSPLTTNTSHTNMSSQQVCIPPVSMEPYLHRWEGAGVHMSPTQSPISQRYFSTSNLSPSDRGYSGAAKSTALSPLAPSSTSTLGSVPAYKTSSCDQQYPDARQHHHGSSQNYNSTNYTATPLYENNPFQSMTNAEQSSSQQYNTTKDYRNVAMESYASTHNSQQPSSRSHFSQPGSGPPGNHTKSSQQAYQSYAIDQFQAQNNMDASSTGPHGQLGGRPVYDSVSPAHEQDRNYQGYTRSQGSQFHEQSGYSHRQSHGTGSQFNEQSGYSHHQSHGTGSQFNEQSGYSDRQSHGTGSQRFMPYHSARGHDPAQSATGGQERAVKVRRRRQKGVKKNTDILDETVDNVQDLSNKKISDKVDTEMLNESTGNTKHALAGKKRDISVISQDGNQKESVVQANKEDRPVTQTTSIHQDMEFDPCMESSVTRKTSKAANTTIVSEEKKQSNTCSQNKTPSHQNACTVGRVDRNCIESNNTVTESNKTMTQSYKPSVTKVSDDDDVIIIDRENSKETGNPCVSEGLGPPLSVGRGHQVSERRDPGDSEGGGPGMSEGESHMVSEGSGSKVREGGDHQVSEGIDPCMSEGGSPRVIEGGNMEEDTPHLQQIHGRCVLCSKYALYLCSSCKKIWYCSPHCQLAHWQAHSPACGM